MSNDNITLQGSVPLAVGGKEILSLTGSAIILEIGGNKVLTDIGLFQGGEGAELFNTTNVDFLTDIDSVIITHPHVDHVGRLPLLFKYGFKGPIYMTPAARKITKEMLLDCYKIQEGEKIERVRRNNKLGSRLREALKIKQSILALEKNDFAERQDKQSVELFINKKLGEGFDKKDALTQISDYLNFYGVKEEVDIGRVINELKQTLFSEDDMFGAIGLIQSLDYSEEKIISSKKIGSKNNNAENQDELNNLPERVAAGFTSEISVDFKSEKRKLKALWDIKLKEEIKRVFDSNFDIEEQKNEFKKELEVAYNFCHQNYAFLDDKNNPNTKDSNTHVEYRGIKKHIQKYKKLLEKYNIENREDISRLIEDKEKVIDIFKINIPFSSADIEKAVHLLKVKNASDNKRKVIGLTLSDAAHVVGSASVNIVSGKVKGRLSNLLEINGNAISVCLSGDLGRIKYNRLGKPELPVFPVNYLQIESTYASKEHRDREESVKDLIDSIEQSKGNVLISVFAQHRLQEILMTLLEEKIKNKTILDYEILIDAPLGKKLTDIYVEYEGEIFNLLDEDVQKEIFGKVVFRFLGELEWMEIYENLDAEGNTINKKHIILASSGMMEGGAILNHLPEILEDPDATILSPGFLCNGTLGNDIVIAGKKVVPINGEKFNVQCNTKFIDGFSSHISHSEILEYITEALKEGKLKLDSTISLNHGMREGQELLKKDIEEILKLFDRKDINVTIPEMFDSYSIEERKISEHKKKQNIKQVKFVEGQKAGIVPSFLLKNINSEETSEDISESEEVINKRTENLDIIRNFQDLYVKIVGKIVKDKKIAILNFLLNTLKKFENNKLFNFLGEIENLGEWQSKSFSNLIEKKINRNRGLKSRVSSQQNKIKNINIIYELIADFKYNIDENIVNLEDEILVINSEIIEKETKILKLKSKIINFENRLKSNIPTKLHKKLTDILVKLWDGDDGALLLLKELCFDSILDLKSDIEISLGELESHITTYLKPKEKSFDGRNIYNELFESKSGNIDLEKIKELFDNNFFSNEDKQFIEEQLGEYNKLKSEKRNGNKQSNHLIRKLRKFIKNKQNVNNDLGINLEVSIEEINKEALNILSQIFEKKYYDDYIYTNFNIYFFLKSKEPFYKYIKRKYNLDELKGFSKEFSETDKTEQEVEDFQEDLGQLLDINSQTTTIKGLDGLNYGITNIIQTIKEKVGELN